MQVVTWTVIQRNIQLQNLYQLKQGLGIVFILVMSMGNHSLIKEKSYFNNKNRKGFVITESLLLSNHFCSSDESYEEGFMVL